MRTRKQSLPEKMTARRTCFSKFSPPLPARRLPAAAAKFVASGVAEAYDAPTNGRSPSQASTLIYTSVLRRNEARLAIRSGQLNRLLHVSKVVGVGASDETSPASFGPVGGCGVRLCRFCPSSSQRSSSRSTRSSRAHRHIRTSHSYDSRSAPFIFAYRRNQPESQRRRSDAPALP